jgi:hypothetical protein
MNRDYYFNLSNKDQLVYFPIFIFILAFWFHSISCVQPLIIIKFTGVLLCLHCLAKLHHALVKLTGRQIRFVIRYLYCSTTFGSNIIKFVYSKRAKFEERISTIDIRNFSCNLESVSKYEIRWTYRKICLWVA